MDKLKWEPDDIGGRCIDTTKGSCLKHIKFVTCRKCNVPLRIEMNREGENNDTWLSIEPMLWINGCWWFCTTCQKVPIKPASQTGGIGFHDDYVKNLLITGNTMTDGRKAEIKPL